MRLLDDRALPWRGSSNFTLELGEMRVLAGRATCL